MGVERVRRDVGGERGEAGHTRPFPTPGSAWAPSGRPASELPTSGRELTPSALSTSIEPGIVRIQRANIRIRRVNFKVLIYKKVRRSGTLDNPMGVRNGSRNWRTDLPERLRHTRGPSHPRGLRWARSKDTSMRAPDVGESSRAYRVVHRSCTESSGRANIQKRLKY